jgi:hypothetical protein
MVAFIQKAHGCIFLYDAIEAQEAQLAISDRPPSSPAAAPRRRHAARHRRTPNHSQGWVIGFFPYFSLICG